MPTILDAVGIAPPDDGRRRAAAADRRRLAAADLRRRGRARSAQHAVLRDARQPRASTTTAGRRRPTTSARSSRSSASRVAGSHDFDQDHWALFHLDDDPAEAHDVGAEHPDGLRTLVELWWTEAGRNQVLPLEDGFIGRAGRARAVAVGLPRRAPSWLPGGGPVSRDAAAADGGRLPPDRPTSRCRQAVRTASSARSATGTTAGRSTSLDGRPVGRVQPLRRRRAASPAAQPLAPGRRHDRGPLPARVARRRADRAARRRRHASREAQRADATCPSAGRSAAPGCWSAATAASRCATTTSRRRRSPAPSSASCSRR